MISVSNEYKEIMSRPVRNRAFLSVGIGIINQNAQEDGKSSGSFAYWSHGSIFNSNQSRVEYATLEQNFLKADGSLLFVPENDELMQLNYNGVVTEDLLGAIRIDFSKIYAIKGITLEFGSAYPTEFTIETKEKTLTYTNNAEKFLTTDVLGDTDYIIITPISMVGGEQRFRVKSVIMGVGLQYSNEQTKSFSHDDFVSSISDELPQESTSFSFYDENGSFDVDNESSFIDYLETMQKITVSFGVELDDGRVEWHQIATNYLKDWNSQKGVVSLKATDRLSQMEDEYSLGYKIYTRTAYQEAENILINAGLEPDEYYIDEYLNDITLTNPMPIGTHKECLQLLANACRCIIRQDENGRIMIKANFATVLDPDDLTVETNGVAKWSKPDNVLIGSGLVYAEMAKDFIKADGQMYFLPEDESYIETAYVSNQVASSSGTFKKNLLKCSDLVEKTINGVTFTPVYNTNGELLYINANGTATANAVFHLNNNIRELFENGRYIISGGASGVEVMAWLYDADKNYIRPSASTGKDATFIVEDGGVKYVTNIIQVKSGNTVDATVFPMIRLASETDSKYHPYQENPTLSISMPAAYTYFGVNIDFKGNAPKELIIHTYKDDELVDSVLFNDLTLSSSLFYEFTIFDKMVFEFTKGYPYNRVLVDKISFGTLSDYVLKRQDMLENPIGFKERRTKSVKVKIFTFQNNSKGEPEEVEDNVFVSRVVHSVGETKTLNNPLVSTQEHAELLAEWLVNYYGNNILYEVGYRGEPRVVASDVIHMESEKKSNLQVEVTSNSLNFNGAFSGKFELRRALKMMGG